MITGYYLNIYLIRYFFITQNYRRIFQKISKPIFRKYNYNRGFAFIRRNKNRNLLIFDIF